MSYVRYRDDIETVPADENEVIDGIIATMTRESQKVAERDGQTVRASHAKSTALATGTLTVLPGLPEPLAQGLFATPRSFPVLLRFAQGPGEKLSDSLSPHAAGGSRGTVAPRRTSCWPPAPCSPNPARRRS